MILVTLGTHPKPMDRLVAEVDRLVESGVITEHVIIQAAAFGRWPRHAEAVGVVDVGQLRQWMQEATQVICHGGPASILEALAAGKRPVVVPRDPSAGEHVDDHQQGFVRWLAARRPIIPVWEVNELQEALAAHPLIEPGVSSSEAVVLRLGELVESVELVESTGFRQHHRRLALRTDTGPSVALVASVRQHVDVFEPIARELRQRDARATVVPLDAWYDQGAEQAARRDGLDLRRVRARRPPSRRGFYRRQPLAIWWDVLQARRALEAATRDAEAIVVGNDSGLLEKLIIHAARRRGAMTALVQDGRLTGSRPRPASGRGALVAILKRALSPILRFVGFPYLAASELGAGGTDMIFASGERGFLILRARAAPRSHVVVSGQPKYDRLIGRQRGGDPDGPVVMFTTPFSAAGLGDRAQLSQLELARRAAAALAAIEVPLVLKPHPREDPSPYRGIPDVVVAAGDVADLLVRARAAVIGASTVVEEAALLGCPVLVPGQIVHENRFDAHLPDPDVFPRFETAGELVDLVLGLHDPGRRDRLIALQTEQVKREVSFDPERPGGAVLAETVLSMLAARR